jgi:hypothetical protein
MASVIMLSITSSPMSASSLSLPTRRDVRSIGHCSLILLSTLSWAPVILARISSVASVVTVLLMSASIEDWADCILAGMLMGLPSVPRASVIATTTSSPTAEAM